MQTLHSDASDQGNLVFWLQAYIIKTGLRALSNM